MIKCLEKSGRTEDEAVAAALAELGMDRDDVSVTVVEAVPNPAFWASALLLPSCVSSMKHPMSPLPKRKQSPPRKLPLRIIPR